MKSAVYAGTFDPITFGHCDIAQRALTLFDRLYVGVAENPAKQPLFSVDERLQMVREALSPLGERVVVSAFSSLLVEFVQSSGARIIVRGLRAVSDYEYEAQMALINRRLAGNIETLFLMTSDHCSFISASIVRDVARYGGDVSTLVPNNVAARLKQKFS